jgi:hypothetical protein
VSLVFNFCLIGYVSFRTVPGDADFEQYKLPKLLNRLPGPKTLLYYLGKDEVVQELGLKVCNSTSFIWRILTANGRILRRTPQEPRPWERLEPLRSWQLDYKDVTSADRTGRQARPRGRSPQRGG